MLVPLYLEFEEKWVILLGRGVIKGSHTMEQTVNLGKVASAPKRMVLNYNLDLLAE